MLIGNYYYKNIYATKMGYLDVLILGVITLFISNGRIDITSFKFNNYFAFIFVATALFVVTYKITFLIKENSKPIKKFLLWCGKESLNFFIVHPFLLAIVPYILMANFNVKDVLSRLEYLLLIYVMVFLTVYLYKILKGYIFKRKFYQESHK